MPRANPTNLVAFRPRLDQNQDATFRPALDNMVVTEGHQLRLWRSGPRGEQQRHDLVSILGQQIGNLIAPGFKRLEIDDADAKIKMNMLKKLAFRGAYVNVDGDKRPTLVAAEDDDYFYLFFSTGFIPTEVVYTLPGGRKKPGLETETDFLEMVRRKIQPTTHGFHDLGGVNSMLATEAGINFSGVETERMWSAVGKDRISGTDIPHLRSDLIRIPKVGGASGMFQDIDGTRGRLVVEKRQLIVVDANGPHYDKFWDLAENQRRVAAAARREAQRLAQGKKVIQPDLFNPGDAVEPETAEPDATVAESSAA